MGVKKVIKKPVKTVVTETVKTVRSNPISNRVIIEASYKDKSAVWNGSYWDTDKTKAVSYKPDEAVKLAKKMKVRTGAVVLIRPKKM